MNLNEISPVWILTSLTGEAFDKFKAAIDQQFLAFSETELNGFENCATQQWWGVETTDGGIVDKLAPSKSYPKDIPAFLPKKFGLFNGNQGIVIYYSPLLDFTKESNYIHDLKIDQLFLSTYGNRFFYGLTSFRKNETVKQCFLESVKNMEAIIKQDNLFDSVTFLSDSSHNALNPDGYLDLDDDDFLALVVNTIFAIALTKGKLQQLCQQQERLYNTAGVFSFTYEPDAMKKEKAYLLSEQLLEAFSNNKQNAEWYNVNDAKTHFDGSDLKKYLHWHSIYEQLSQGFHEESMNGLYSKSEISPWRMFAYKLVPFYFKKHVKPLLRKLYDNVHDFSSLTVMRYESFAKNKRKQMLEGSANIEKKEQFSKSAIASYLSSVWNTDYDGAKGVQQVLLLLKKTKDYLVVQKDEVARVKKFESPNDEKHKGFPKLLDYPLTEITKKGNEHYYKHYEELVTNGEPAAENTEEAGKSYEERLLSKLHNLLKWHAMPLNLFTKAGLLSAMAFVTVWAVISIVQNTNLVHLFSLNTKQSLIALFVATAVIVLTFAFVKYGLKTLRKIRLAVQKYIAWSYYKVQLEVYRVSLDEEGKYYDELIKECERIDKQLNDFVGLKVENEPSFEKYKISKFQRNILGNMDDRTPILSRAALNMSLRINNIDYSPDDVVPGLFTAMLRGCGQRLNEKMRDRVLNEVSAEGDGNAKEELLKVWLEALTDNIDVTINGQYGNTVDFPAFNGTKTSNFTDQAWLSTNAIIHPSVYVHEISPLSWVFSLVPFGGGVRADRWENMFYGSYQPNDVDQRVPDFAQVQNPHGWSATQQIAVFMCIHAYDRLIVKDNNDNETTIFNNQL